MIQPEYRTRYGLTKEVNSDENLPLSKILKVHNMRIIIRSVFEEHGKFYP